MVITLIVNWRHYGCSTNLVRGIWPWLITATHHGKRTVFPFSNDPKADSIIIIFQLDLLRVAVVFFFLYLLLSVIFIDKSSMLIYRLLKSGLSICVQNLVPSETKCVSVRNERPTNKQTTYTVNVVNYFVIYIIISFSFTCILLLNTGPIIGRLTSLPRNLNLMDCHHLGRYV